MYGIYGNMDPINIPPVMLALMYQHHGSYGLVSVLKTNYGSDRLDLKR